MRRYVAEMEAKGKPPWTVPEGGKPLSERQIRNYVAAADKLIAESSRQCARSSCATTWPCGEPLRPGRERRGHQGSMAVLQDLAKLQDLYPADKVEHTGPTKVVLEYTNDWNTPDAIAAVAAAPAMLPDKAPPIRPADIAPAGTQTFVCVQSQEKYAD